MGWHKEFPGMNNRMGRSGRWEVRSASGKARGRSLLLACALLSWIGFQQAAIAASPNTGAVEGEPTRSGGIAADARLMVEFRERSVAELKSALEQLAEAFRLGQGYPKHVPVRVVLYDAVAEPFVEENFAAHRQLVSQAAQLQALGMAEFTLCAVWLDVTGRTEEDLPKFVHLVPNGPFHEDRLRHMGFQPLQLDSVSAAN